MTRAVCIETAFLDVPDYPDIRAFQLNIYSVPIEIAFDLKQHLIKQASEFLHKAGATRGTMHDLPIYDFSPMIH